MRIKNITEKTIGIGSSIRNAVVDFSTMTVSVVVIETDVFIGGQQVIGYGFNSNGRYSQGGIIKERLIPRLYQAKKEDLLNEEQNNFDPFKCLKIMMQNEKPGGHGERSVAVGTLDMAIWDIVSKIERKPLYKLLADKYRNGCFDEQVFVYAAGGYYYPGKDIEGLNDEIKKYKDLGFTACKIKVGGATFKEDVERIEQAIKSIGESKSLAIDVNGRFDAKTGIEFGKIIDDYNLMWYEEVVDPLDFLANYEVKSEVKTPIATGENIFSYIDTLNLIRYSGLNPKTDFIQVDPVLSYGLAEYIPIINMLEENGWSSRRCIPHGGHLFGVHIAAGLGLFGMEAYPEVFAPFGKFSPEMTVEEGKVGLTQIPGIGFELVPEIYNVLKS